MPSRPKAVMQDSKTESRLKNFISRQVSGSDVTRIWEASESTFLSKAQVRVGRSLPFRLVDKHQVRKKLSCVLGCNFVSAEPGALLVN